MLFVKITSFSVLQGTRLQYANLDRFRCMDSIVGIVSDNPIVRLVPDSLQMVCSTGCGWIGLFSICKQGFSFLCRVRYVDVVSPWFGGSRRGERAIHDRAYET